MIGARALSSFQVTELCVCSAIVRPHLAPTTIQTEEWETLRQDQTLKPLAKGPLNLASRLILFAPPTTKWYTLITSVNNKKHYCQHVMIRRSCIKVQIPTFFFFFFCKIQKCVTLVLNWYLLRSSRAGLWPPLPTGQRSARLPRSHLFLLSP